MGHLGLLPSIWTCIFLQRSTWALQIAERRRVVLPGTGCGNPARVAKAEAHCNWSALLLLMLKQKKAWFVAADPLFPQVMIANRSRTASKASQQRQIEGRYLISTIHHHLDAIEGRRVPREPCSSRHAGHQRMWRFWPIVGCRSSWTPCSQQWGNGQPLRGC